MSGRSQFYFFPWGTTALAGKNALEYLAPELVEHDGKTSLGASKDHVRMGISLTPLPRK